MQALAGPAAGPNGGQIYIDGFEGGQIPPKADILEIRVNQNPFSAEYDRIGYGRIEIITKPGSQKFQGSIDGFGTDSALNTANPFLARQPSYYQYSYSGNVSGPITKTASYFFNAFTITRQNQSIVDALNPANLSNSSKPSLLRRTISTSIRASISRSRRTTSSASAINTPATPRRAMVWARSISPSKPLVASTGATNCRSAIPGSSTLTCSWSRASSGVASATTESPILSLPSVTVQGAFTTGGNGTGVLQDHQDIFMLAELRHRNRRPAHPALRRAAPALTAMPITQPRAPTAAYYFSTVAAYQAATPSQYSATVINNPLARVLLFDGSLFAQDDWHVSHSFLLGLGLRYEAQNYIHDHDDWAPRIAFAWTPGHPGKTPAKTVIRAGYGWFFNRFIMPTAFTSGVEPYIITANHDNLINQKSYTVTNPGFYNPNAAEPASVLTSSTSSIPTFHSVDPHFHAALDMQAGIGVDRQIAKHITGNVTYLYTQGVHQYMTNNVTAPAFDISDYTITGPTPSFTTTSSSPAVFTGRISSSSPRPCSSRSSP